MTTEIENIVMNTFLYVYAHWLFASWFILILWVAIMSVIGWSDVHYWRFGLINRNRNNYMDLLKFVIYLYHQYTQTPHKYITYNIIYSLICIYVYVFILFQFYLSMFRSIYKASVKVRKLLHADLVQLAPKIKKTLEIYYVNLGFLLDILSSLPQYFPWNT